MIHKLLIANRGEIAVRIIRTAREMGIRTVAVYSEADRHAMHVAMADESVCLGESEPSNSYLAINKILEAARQTGADAIHPGYGFLSERSEFSEACAAAGIIFVGPTADAMRRLGSKSDAKAIAVEVGVPIVPGCFDHGATSSQLRDAALNIGYPIMLKASAGGGGRGMRVVRDPNRFDEELAMASDEALKSFGDGAMMVEKLVERPRHIEVQVLADIYGNVACLFERECSIQRRHQKLIEESPSPYLSEHPGMWDAMAEASRKLVRATGYTGAGTVEYMVDGPAEKFYFLEVNTRLQVEHPVTEEITGLDLVRLQLEIADGKPISLPKELMEGNRSAIRGHAIEIRVVAEDPAQGFMPSIGKVLAWAEPQGPGVRVDTGFGPGAEVTRYYDSLVAKVIVHGTDRSTAIRRMILALSDFHVLGIQTNLAFQLDVLQHPKFEEGEIDTDLVAREFGEWSPGPLPVELGSILAASVVGTASGLQPSVSTGVWELADAFRNIR